MFRFHKQTIVATLQLVTYLNSMLKGARRCGWRRVYHRLTAATSVGEVSFVGLLRQIRWFSASSIGVIVSPLTSHKAVSCWHHVHNSSQFDHVPLHTNLANKNKAGGLMGSRFSSCAIPSPNNQLLHGLTIYKNNKQNQQTPQYDCRIKN